MTVYVPRDAAISVPAGLPEAGPDHDTSYPGVAPLAVIVTSAFDPVHAPTLAEAVGNVLETTTKGVRYHEQEPPFISQKYFPVTEGVNVAVAPPVPSEPVTTLAP